MAIRKQEFYEGAALYQLARTGRLRSVRYEPPIFTFNDTITVLLKYSTKPRSPWPFTFSTEERRLLVAHAESGRCVVGLVCASDGVVALDYAEFDFMVGSNSGAVHISCRRSHGSHYAVRGPEAELEHRVPQLSWPRILD